MSTDCTSFKPDHLRPDKCANCSGQAARHKSLARSATSEIDKLEQWTKEKLIGELRECREKKCKLENDVGEKVKLVSQYEQQIDKLKLELEQANFSVVVSKNETADDENCCKRCKEKLDELVEELEQFKSRCGIVEEERDLAREEVRALEQEMEEMHDNFKEEESEQFEQVKQELDLALKNCKILQIRLNKAERQYNQLEQVKSLLERQLEESGGLRQQELVKATEINCNQFAEIGTDFVKLSANEYDQLIRDLNDTIEREKDLQEQIKYSQEEAQLKGDRLAAVETENEVLLSKVNKLTLASSRWRSKSSGLMSKCDDRATGGERDESLDLLQQNEQLKLALEIAQSECERIKGKWLEVRALAESRESSLKEMETKRIRLEDELAKLKLLQSEAIDGSSTKSTIQEQVHSLTSRMELECRQLRTKLMHSERECKQLKGQLELSSNGRQSRAGGENVRRGNDSSSSTTTSGEQAKFKEINRQLREQCDSLVAQNEELERKVEQLSTNQNVGRTVMESDLLEKLKRQLDTSESELAKARSRLVEMDVECGRIQRQYKRLVESLEKSESESVSSRRVKLPVESMRDSMSRQELRQALKELEEEVDECLAVIRSKDCLVKEQSQRIDELSRDRSVSPSSQSEEQVRSLHRLIDQERLLSNNLKIEVAKLEKEKQEVAVCNRASDREQAAMEEELDKLRQVNSEINLELSAAKEAQRELANKLKELQVANEKLRAELATVQQVTKQANQLFTTPSSDSPANQQTPVADGGKQDLLLLNRDLSELKVKNGFLMRQLEIAREDNARQLDDLRLTCEAQQRRAVELAQLELKERQLGEAQQLREELNDTKQRLATCQRQAARSEEEASGERERLRSLERDWRRDKSQWQQRVEQLEAQMTIERRSNEFKVKEGEGVVREKEREMIGMQGKYVQMERDLKRLQNKYNLLEENSESKQKSLHRDLEAKKRELSEALARFQTREDEYYENCKRFNKEKATVLEALDSIKRSYDDKLAELKSVRQLLLVRQDQSYKERSSAQEKIDSLNAQLVKMGDHEMQVRLVKQQLQLQEKQLETLKRESLQLKEDRLRLRTKCEDLERRCSQYEKQELISKTSTITTNSFLKRGFLGSSKEQSNSKRQLSNLDSSEQQSNGSNDRKDQCSMIERLTSKINDQRNLMNMLKQQHDEAQMELKQMKLVQSAERNKWQSRVAQLTSQLNESEEKLLFESSSMLSQETVDNSRRKLESKWAQERQTILSNVQHLQSQNEMLVRDMKKLSQSHDLLRLQSKQLESYNNKLSRKLIEYQQQPPIESFTSREPPRSLSSATRDSVKLDECLSERNKLLARQEELIEANAKLVRIMQDQAKPMVETVKKIMIAVDGASAATTQLKSPNFSLDLENRSTSRPLMTPAKQRLSDDTSDTSSMFGADHTISSGQPAHKVAAIQQQPSRLSRFLGKQQPKQHDNEETTHSQLESASSQVPKSTVKTVKRVKVKASSLGITLVEKKRLRSHLQELSSVLDDMSSIIPNYLSNSNTTKGDERSLRSSSEIPSERKNRDLMTTSNVQTTRAASSTPNRQPHSQSETDSPHSRVHWQDDGSDLDSEKSWSLEPTGKRTNVYRRFPQALPATRSSGASLTDYESESSLASDFAILTNQNRSITGAESDSCMQTSTGQSKLKSSGRKRGLKGRLTSTLRHISRSITGLGSDSESETMTENSRFKQTTRKENDRQTLQEIRV